MQLQEMYDYIKKEIDGRRYVCLASIDIDWAFDKVPRDRLMATLPRLDVDPFILCFLQKWMRARRFSVRLATLVGQFFSGFLDGSNFTKPTHTFLVLFGGFFSLCIFVCVFVFLKVAGCRGSEICFHVV